MADQTRTREGWTGGKTKGFDNSKRLEAAAYWQNRTMQEKFDAIQEIIRMTYELKGIDVSQQRLQRTDRDS